MKIGLVPLLYNEYNYGGVLQFYALQYILKKEGFECEIVFFHNDEKVSFSRLRFDKRLILKAKIFLASKMCRKKSDLIDRKLIKRRGKIENFKKIYYSKIVDEKEIDIKSYDAFICGSDQIWNPAWARRRSFLEFVPDDTNKIIYAASFGCDSMTEEQKRSFKPRIERLNHVSVREASAKKMLESFVKEKKIELVLDPTLLLSRKEWRNIEKRSKHKDYILTYFLGKYSDKMKYLRAFAEKKGLKTINIAYASGEREDLNNFGDIKMINVDPSEFLGLIDGAEYVFTDSFHACVFSMLFNKEFYVFQRDGSNKMMGRITTLFNNFKLPNRIIQTGEINELPRIDYSYIDNLQERLKNKSIGFLLESLNE